MTFYSDTLRDEDQRPIGGASIAVYDSTGTLDTLTDAGGLSIANPVLTDAFGNFSFSAADGLKTLDITLGGRRIWKEQIMLGVLTAAQVIDQLNAAAAVVSAATAASAASAAAARSAARAAAATAKTIDTKGRAVDLLGAESGSNSWALDATTTTTAKAVGKITSGGAVTESGIGTTFSAWGTGKSVQDADGTVRTTAAGEVPVDYSRGVRTIKIANVDDFKVTAANSIADPKTFYAEFYVKPTAGVTSADAFGNIFGYDTSGADYARVQYNTTGTNISALIVPPSGTGFTVTAEEGFPDGTVLFKVTIRSQANGCGISINGRPEVFHPEAGVLGAFTQLIVKPEFSRAEVFLKKLVMTGRYVSSDELATWQAGTGPYGDERIIASAPVGRYAEDANTFMVREPAAVKLYDKRNKVGFLVAYGQKRNVAGVNEWPQRIRCRRLEYDRDARTLTRVGLVTTVYENPSWSSNLGHSTGPALLLLKTGRIVCVFNDEIGAGLDPGSGNSNRPLKSCYSDDQGLSWSAPATLAAAGVADFRILGSPNMVYFSDPLSPYFGRHVAMIYQAGGIRFIYSTDGFVSNCTLGALITVSGGYTATEGTLALRADGTIVASVRTETNGVRGWVTSADGGATGTWVGTQSGFTGIPVMGALVNLSPNGGQGAAGGLVQGNPEDTGLRCDFQFKNVNGATGALTGTYRPYTKGLAGNGTITGYSQVVDIDGNEVLHIHEKGSNAGRVDLYSINASVIRLHGIS